MTKLLVWVMLIAGNIALCSESEIRVAVIDHGGAPELCVLLESRLAEDKNWQVLNRDEALLGAALAEKQIQSLVKNNDWAALRQLTRVDVLVLAGKNKEGKIWARFIAIAPACVLTETWFDHDPSQIDVQAGYLKSLLDRDRSKLGASKGNVVKLSVGSVAANTPDPYLRLLEHPLQARLLHRLANDPGVILNERRNLDNVIWERSLDSSMQIAPPTGQTALSLNLVRKNLELHAKCSLLFPDGRAIEHTFTIALDPEKQASVQKSDMSSANSLLAKNDDLQLDESSNKIVRWVIQSCLGDKGGSNTFSAEVEAAYYARQARFLATCGMASQGAAAADAAWALGHRTPELLRHQIMAHAMLAFPMWNGLQDWDLTRPPRSGNHGDLYRPIALTQEPWRITEAIRTGELLRIYLHLYKDRIPEGFDDDPRIIGARCLYNTSCVLMSAYEFELNKDSAYTYQIATLRSLIADSSEELLRMPCTYNSSALYSQIAPFIPLWAESLDHRIKILDLYLESPKEAAINNWYWWAKDTAFFSRGLDTWLRGSRNPELDRDPTQAIEGKGNPVGMVFPWEPDALKKRKELLDTFVAMTRNPDTKKQDKGWALWLLWWGNERNVRGYNHLSRFDHDFPGFNHIEEAREAWGAPKGVDFQQWIQAKQAVYANEVKSRLPRFGDTRVVLFAGPWLTKGSDISFYQWYLREKLIPEWAKEKEDSYADREGGPNDLYIPPKSLITLKPLTIKFNKPEVPDKTFAYQIDGENIYVLPLRKGGKPSRLDPSSNRLLPVDVPQNVLTGVDTRPEEPDSRWSAASNMTIRLGPQVSWLLGDKRFAYKLASGDWHIEENPGGSPVVHNDRLYFLASTEEGKVNLQVGSGRAGALYEFNPLEKKTNCLFSTRRFPPQTILDAHEPANPVAVYSSSKGVLHVLTAEEQQSLWCIYRRKADGDFERVNAVACPYICSGSVHICGSQKFLLFGARVSNAPYCFWSSWAMLDGDSPDGLKVLWQDPRFDPPYLPFPADIPPGRENGPYVKHGNFSYRIEDLGKYSLNDEEEQKNRRFQIEILDHQTKQYYSVPLSVEPLPDNEKFYLSSSQLAATPDGLWIGCGSRYALIPYKDISPNL